MEDKMKQYFFPVSLLVLVFLSCGVTNLPDVDTYTNPAKVIIPLPTKSQARSVSINDVKSYTDSFEVFFRKTKDGGYDYYSASASYDEAVIEILIPVGIYDILLFAGAKDGIPDQYPSLLLASSYAQNVNITLENENIINLTLSTFECDLSVPSKVVINENFNVDVTINTNNPLIDTLKFNLGFQSIGVPNDDRLNVGYNNNVGNVYTYTQNFVAPSVVGNGSVSIWGASFKPFSSSVLNTWKFATGGDPNLNHHFRKEIEFVEGADVSINISWPE
jgi:hypothetical protein